jgi:hypothetical protein
LTSIILGFGKVKDNEASVVCGKRLDHFQKSILVLRVWRRVSLSVNAPVKGDLDANLTSLL